jgi:hypothetical protein
MDNVTIFWKNSVFVFTANVGGEAMLQSLLEFLQRHGVPLGESATRVLQKAITPQSKPARDTYRR